MSLKTFVEAMPKVELNVHLEGSFDINRLLLIAEQYEINETLKHFDDWAALLRKPDYARLYDILRVANSWIRDSEDLSKVTYDLGTQLHKQHVQYAEVGVCPSYYPDVALDLEGFFAAINDGRDRAERAWGIRMSWILNVPRDEPRRAEDAVRWGSSIPAQRASVVGLGIVGRDDVQPPGQFEKPFRAAEKRDLTRVVRVGEVTGVNGIRDTLDTLNPTRIIDGRGVWDDSELMTKLAEQGTTLLFSPSRVLKQKWVDSAANLPVRTLIDGGVNLVIGSDMPTLYQTSLNQEYLLAAEKTGLSPDDLAEIALTAVKQSALPSEEKFKMRDAFRTEYDALLAEHFAKA